MGEEGVIRHVSRVHCGIVILEYICIATLGPLQMAELSERKTYESRWGKMAKIMSLGRSKIGIVEFAGVVMVARCWVLCDGKRNFDLFR